MEKEKDGSRMGRTQLDHGATSARTDSVGQMARHSPTTSAAGDAVVRLFLIHEPTTKSGNSRTDFGGETDVQVDLNVAVSE